MRSYLDLENLDFVFWVLGITTSIVAVLYVLNIFNIDLIGAYADTAVVERAQFFSTLGQKDFNGCFFSVALIPDPLSGPAFRQRLAHWRWPLWIQRRLPWASARR